MDTGKGRFEVLNTLDNDELERLKKLYPEHGGVFQEGEIVEIKGSRFKISKIIRNGLKLRLLPK